MLRIVTMLNPKCTKCTILSIYDNTGAAVGGTELPSFHFSMAIDSMLQQSQQILLCARGLSHAVKVSIHYSWVHHYSREVPLASALSHAALSFWLSGCTVILAENDSNGSNKTIICLGLWHIPIA